MFGCSRLWGEFDGRCCTVVLFEGVSYTRSCWRVASNELWWLINLDEYLFGNDVGKSYGCGVEEVGVLCGICVMMEVSWLLLWRWGSSDGGGLYCVVMKKKNIEMVENTVVNGGRWNSWLLCDGREWGRMGWVLLWEFLKEIEREKSVVREFCVHRKNNRNKNSTFFFHCNMVCVSFPMVHLSLSCNVPWVDSPSLKCQLIQIWWPHCTEWVVEPKIFLQIDFSMIN